MVWPRPEGTADADQASLRLALGLADRQRRSGESGNPPDGFGALDPRGATALSAGLESRWTAWLRRRRHHAKHIGCIPRLSARSAHIRGARLAFGGGLETNG